MQRYIRQMTFSGIGKAGQEILSTSRVAVVGVGALGTVAANCLARSGIGFLRLIDKDYVETLNLHRQILYTEEDAERRVPKAVAAHTFLAQANSGIQIDSVVAELNADNAESLLADVDIVLDDVDHWETRFLINKVCQKKKLPWIYCAALGSEAMTMNFLPGEFPCLQCVVSPAVLQQQPTCAEVGILNMTTGMIASLQSGEAVKILLGSPLVRQGLFVADFWNNRFKTFAFDKDPLCACCGTTAMSSH